MREIAKRNKEELIKQQSDTILKATTIIEELKSIIKSQSEIIRSFYDEDTKEQKKCITK
jgi:hypothetical protein